MSSLSQLAKAARLAVAALTVAAFATPADARVGGGFSTGSRGLKTYTPPPSTRTAPGTTQGVQRSTQPAPQAQVGRPALGAPAAAPSRFGSGFLGGLLGAGLIGGLLGYGFFAGFGSLLGLLGMVAQFALFAWLASMAFAWWRRRGQPAMAGPAGSSNTYQRASLTNDQPRPQGSAAGATARPVPGTTPLKIADADYASFERLLSVAQLSFGRGDVAALRSATTPEMLGYFTDQLEENTKQGLRNEIADPKLISGDLSEAWSEASGEYASVAMRYTLLDVMVNQASGKPVSGSTTQPQDVTEVWTFTRRHGGSPNSWRLSAIQQVS